MKNTFSQTRDDFTFFVQMPEQPDWFMTRQLSSQADWDAAETPVGGDQQKAEIRSFERGRIDPDKLVKIGVPKQGGGFLSMFLGERATPAAALKELVKINKDIGHDVCRNLVVLMAQDPAYAARCIENIETFSQVVRDMSATFSFFGAAPEDQTKQKLDPRARIAAVNAVSAFFERIYDAAESGRTPGEAEVEALAAGITNILDEKQLGNFLSQCCRFAHDDADAASRFILGQPEKTCLPDVPVLVSHYWPEVKKAMKDAEGVQIGANFMMFRPWVSRNTAAIINVHATERPAATPRLLPGG